MIVVWVTCCMNTALILYAVKDNKELPVFFILQFPKNFSLLPCHWMR